MRRAVTACVTDNSDSNITLKENGRRLNIINEGNISYLVVKVDGCLITDGIRADWIITKIGTGSIILELKGRNIDQALKQLFATLAHDNCRDWIESKRSLIIVCSRVPSFDTTIAKAQVVARRAGVKLKAICVSASLTFDELVS